MAQIQVIRRRIKSVTNTRQITKAMELVAASKMRRAQEATFRSRPYAATAKEVLGRLAQIPGTIEHPLFEQRNIKTQLIVLLSSDRGLAGAYNSNLFRLLVQTLRTQPTVTTKLVVIGQKGISFISRLEGVELIGTYPNWPTEPTAADVRPLVHTIQAAYTSHEVDSVVVLYNAFVSTIMQKPTFETLLPFDIPSNEPMSQSPSADVTRFEPSTHAVVASMVPRLLEAQLYQVNLEAIASEQSMRMMAMKQASDNAESLIDDLTLTYNSARQASITQELAEISAGSMAHQI